MGAGMADGTMGMDDGFVPGPETARRFRDALGRFATGVTVVTGQGPEGPVGLTANSFSSLSLDPALVMWSPARASRRGMVLARAERFAIHVLGLDQAALCWHFAKTGEDMALPEVSFDADGVPVIAGALARFDCQRWAVYDGGDHEIVVGRVLRATLREGAPMVFSAGKYGTFQPG